VTLEIARDPEVRGESRRTGDHHGAARRADIQGLRAVAVFLVVAYHAGLPVPGGFIGVDMFFVISGFVIAGMLVRQLDQAPTLSFSSFYTRRMRRLLPALAVLTVVTALGSILLLSPLGPQQATARTGIAASLFSANVQLGRAGGGGYFDLATETNALLHTWSLSVEEQFYLVFPAFLMIAWRLAARFRAAASRRRTAAAVVFAATTASFLLCCYLTYRPNSQLGRTFAFYSPFTRAWEFGVGVLLALIAPSLIRAARRGTWLLGVGGFVLIGIGAFTITSTSTFPGIKVLLPVVGTAALLVAGMAPSRGPTALLSVRPATWIGDVSYGWYLWHWPLIVFAAAMWPGRGWVLVLVAIVSLVPTWVSYRFIETPIRFNDSLVGRRVLALVILCIAVPIVACVGLLMANRAETNSDAVKALSAALRPHVDSTRACDGPSPIGQRGGSSCTWPVEDPNGKIFLVGDSNAGHFAEAAVDAARREGRELTVATYSACPFVDTVVTGPQIDGPRCHQFVTDSVAALEEQRPALVLVASSSTHYINHDEFQFRDPHTGAVAGTPEAKAKLWEDGVASVLGQLAGAGIPTVVIHTAPHPQEEVPNWGPATCPALRMFTDSCGSSFDRATVEEQQRPARDAENSAVARVPGSASVDFTDDLCAADRCVTTRDGVWLYGDGDHLSVDGALTLADRFRDLIARHATSSRGSG
jgi:peptidoglycan/LPS O-acetylase OafA/YrhL